MNKLIKTPLSLIFVAITSFITKTEKASAQITINVKNPISAGDFAKIVENFLLWILSVAGAVALFMLIVGGITYMTAGGDEQKATTAKKMIAVTILGLTLILISYSVIKVLDDILT